MFVLRTVRVNTCSEGAVSTKNFNRQHVISDVVVSIYPTTRRHSPESHNRNFLAVRCHTCVVARFFVLSTCRADWARHRVKEDGHAVWRRWWRDMVWDYWKEMSRYLAQVISDRPVTAGAPMPVHVGLVKKKVPMWQGFPEVQQFSPACIIPPKLRTRISFIYHRCYMNLAIGSFVKQTFLSFCCLSGTHLEKVSRTMKIPIYCAKFKIRYSDPVRL
jgi:hypothetical protein